MRKNSKKKTMASRISQVNIGTLCTNSSVQYTFHCYMQFYNPFCFFCLNGNQQIVDPINACPTTSKVLDSICWNIPLSALYTRGCALNYWMTSSRSMKKQVWNHPALSGLCGTTPNDLVQTMVTLVNRHWMESHKAWQVVCMTTRRSSPLVTHQYTSMSHKGRLCILGRLKLQGSSQMRIANGSAHAWWYHITTGKPLV